MIDKESSYHGNPNLKAIGYQHQFTPEEIQEFVKCQKDPIYFIETYCHIVSLDKGLIKFKLYDCQKKKVEPEKFWTGIKSCMNIFPSGCNRVFVLGIKVMWN